MNRVLVTGATGFIGSFLMPLLSKNNIEFFCLNSKDGDVAEIETWNNLPQAKTVIHLAAKSFVPYSWQEPSEFFRTNVQGTVCALTYCKKHNARLILPSSYLYGNPKKLPISEKADTRPTNPYALSKKIAEEVCAFFSDSWNIPVTILRIFNVYGPNQPSNFLIQNVISQLASNTISVKDLEPKRDYIFVEDVCDALVKCINLETRFDIINIGSGKSYSVNEVIDLIQKMAGTDLPIHSKNERRQDEIMNTIADISLAKSLLGWSPKISFEEGLTRIIHS